MQVITDYLIGQSATDADGNGHLGNITLEAPRANADDSVAIDGRTVDDAFLWCAPIAATPIRTQAN